MGEIVTSVQKTTLVPGGDEVVLYGTCLLYTSDAADEL